MILLFHDSAGPRMRYRLRAQLGQLVSLVEGDHADGVAKCPCCGVVAGILRGELMCLHCGCRHVPDRSVSSHGPYHDATAWQLVDGPGLHIEGWV